MKKVKGFKKYNRRKRYMEKVKAKLRTKDLFNMLVEQGTNDWTKLCENCTTLVKEAKMSDEDIDKIVERVKKENG
jgi:hypothetical protein